MMTVLVNGLPGAGKTTLARELAGELGLPLLSKDTVKESLSDALANVRGPGVADGAWERALGRAAGETLWALLGEARGNAVVEAPYLAHLREVAAAGLTRAGVAPQDVREVWCEVPVALARERFARRAGQRHPVHPERAEGQHGDWELWARNAQPLGFGAVHRVDTARTVDVPALARELTAGPPPAGAVERARELLRELGAAELDHPGGTLLAHLERVHERLNSWGAGPGLALAGLCHAFYGTDGFAGSLLPTGARGRLRSVIGAAAEATVYFYASCDRKASYRTLADSGAAFRDRFAGRTFTPPLAARCDFAELTAVNELDLARHDPAFREHWGPSLRTLFTRWAPLLSPAARQDAERVLGGG